MKIKSVFCFILSTATALSVLSGCDVNVISSYEKTENSFEQALSSEVVSSQNSPSEENSSVENVSSENTNSAENSSDSSSNVTSKPQNSDMGKEDGKSDKEEEKGNGKDDEYVAKAPERDPSKSETEQWYMVLANPDNEVSKEYISAVNKATINKSFTDGKESSKYLDSRVVEAYEAMCKAAKKDGISLKAVSAYRTYAYQENLYNKRVKRFMNEQGMSEEEAKKEAATRVAIPGTSEHHLGLAVDINSVETSFENTKAFKWLQKNAENYGFVLRYPKDKKAITKIIYEPWHYRYVGVEHAKEMNRLGLCLEEYIDLLNDQNPSVPDAEN